MTSFHTLRRAQWVPRSFEEVFAFFSDARNLQVITPPWLGFRILTPEPIPMAAGTRIRYRLSRHGIPVNRTTEIRRWEAPFRFVDTQAEGPYGLWHHAHIFEEHRGGTRIRDVVRDRLPLGRLDRIVHSLAVRRDVERVFDYRFERIRKIFGGPQRGEET